MRKDGAVLLRKLADQAGLTGALGPALARAGKFPLVDRGAALVSMAVAIMLGATSMNDITLLARHARSSARSRAARRCGGRWSWPIRPPWTRSPGCGSARTSGS